MTSDNTSKQNLETIVEAIRHLEGDQLGLLVPALVGGFQPVALVIVDELVATVTGKYAMPLTFRFNSC